MKVVNVRYFNTRRGLGYECKTNTDKTIWNDGTGGGTYIDGLHEYNGLTGMKLENYLESLIDKLAMVGQLVTSGGPTTPFSTSPQWEGVNALKQELQQILSEQNKTL